jgi:hypothetical protein
LDSLLAAVGANHCAKNSSSENVKAETPTGRILDVEDGARLFEGEATPQLFEWSNG